MPTLRARATRFDPYKNFKFRVKWDGRYVAGVSRMSALKRITEVIEARDGSDPTRTRLLPGPSKYEAITLERGISHDADFERWANEAGSSPGFRKDIVIELYDEAGRLALAYNVHRCWVSEFQALPELDANANAVAIEHIKLENEGWERDPAVPTAIEPGSRRRRRPPGAGPGGSVRP